MSAEASLAIIVAQSSNRVIGIENRLPWHLPEDLKYFKSVTMGKPIVMGRKTFESIGRPLPGRKNIVITRQSDWQADGVAVTHSLDEALAMGRSAAAEASVGEVMVIGGAEIYREALSLAETLYVTEVGAELQGDAHFPEILDTQWREVERSESYPAELDGAPISYSFVTYKRS